MFTLTENPNPLGIDGSVINTILTELVDSLGAIFLDIIVQIFYVFLNFIYMLLLGHWVSNPAVFLIAIMFFVTAYITWSR